MRRILATLAVIALLFSAGSAWADSNSEANKLFVGAVKWMKVSENENDEGRPEWKAKALEVALRMLKEIIDDNPSSDLAVKLISGQNIGTISLEDVGEAAESARGEADRALERARKEAERERKEADARAKYEMMLTLAEQGDADAQYNLGIIYRHGIGVPKNDTEAFKWYGMAAEQGHASAQNNLGDMYRRTLIYALAFKWYRKAAEQGHEGAKARLEELEAK